MLWDFLFVVGFVNNIFSLIEWWVCVLRKKIVILNNSWVIRDDILDG